MKFEQIIPSQKLDEVRMAPSNLDQFIRSPECHEQSTAIVIASS